MEPGTHVPSHRGLTKAWLNCHLPLILPQDSGRCEIEIAGAIHRWHEGQWLVFDETFPHEVWNLTGQPRLSPVHADSQADALARQGAIGRNLSCDQEYQLRAGYSPNDVIRPR